MKLNVDKCKILSIKRIDEDKFAYGFNKDNNNFALEHVNHIKDLGVIRLQVQISSVLNEISALSFIGINTLIAPIITV